MPADLTEEELAELERLALHHREMRKRFDCDDPGVCHDCEDEDFAEALWKHRAALLRDARALRRVEALPDKWREEARRYPDTPEGDHAAAAVRLCAREIEKALASATEPASERGEGST